LLYISVAPEDDPLWLKHLVPKTNKLLLRSRRISELIIIHTQQDAKTLKMRRLLSILAKIGRIPRIFEVVSGGEAPQLVPLLRHSIF
jgi:hypothetical protein